MKWTYKKEELKRFDSFTGEPSKEANYWIRDEKNNAIALSCANVGNYRSNEESQAREENAKLIALTPEMFELITKLASHSNLINIDSLKVEAKAIIAKLK